MSAPDGGGFGGQAAEAFWAGRRAVFLSGTAGDTRRYRCEYQAEQLNLVGAVCEVVACETEWSIDDVLAETDVLVLHRVEWNDDVGALLEAAHARGTPTVFDTDDLVFEPGMARETSWYLDRSPAERLASFALQRRTLESCGAATVSTRPLAYRARAVVDHVAVTFNALGAEVVQEAVAARELRPDLPAATIGYLSGTPTHDADFLEAADALLMVLRDVPSARLLIVGHLQLDDRFDEFGDRIELLPFQERARLPALLVNCAASIAPLETGNPFANAKSCLKYLEAGAAGVASVVSPVPDYVRVVQSSRNGLLASSTGEWYRSLRRLLEDVELRESMARRALDDVLALRTTRAQAPQLARSLASLAAAVSASSKTRRTPSPATSDEPSLAPDAELELELELAYSRLREQALELKAAERELKVAEHKRAADRANEERLSQQVADSQQRAEAALAEAGEYAALLRAVYATKSWRLMRPLRAVRRVFPPPRQPPAGSADGAPDPLTAFLFVSGAPDVSRRYRCDNQAEALALLGVTSTCVRHGAADLDDLVERHAAIVLHRVAWGPDVARLVERARELGRPVIFDTDDQVFDPAVLPHVAALETLPPEEVKLYAEGLERYRRTLLEADAVTVSTEPLRDAAAELHRRVEVAPNLASRQMVASAERALVEAAGLARPFTVGYFSGTNTHDRDFLVAADAVVDFLERHPTARLAVVGPLRLDERFAALGERVERLPLQTMEELAGLQAAVDVSLAPLEPRNAFTVGKSCVKWIESGLVGVPTVASREPDFVRAIEDGVSGFLAGEAADWSRALEALAGDQRVRRRVGDAARRAVAAGHTTVSRSSAVVETFARVVPEREQPLTINWILRAPIARNSGGYRNIFRIARELGSRGHAQRLYVEAIAHLGGLSDREIGAFVERSFGIPDNATVVVGHDRIAAADVSIASHWPTARAVASHSRSLFKAYFIQDYEPEFYEASDPLAAEAARTYSFPLRHICLGRHLGHRIEEVTRLPADVVDFALDPEFGVTRPPAERGEPVRVLFFARPSLRRRGYAVGVDALALLKAARPEVEIVFFGTAAAELGEVPFAFTNLGILDAAGVAEAMNEAHILLTFSLTNISNVPYEGMACGCAVVDLDSPNVSTMVDAGETCVLAPFDPHSIAQALTELVDDPPRRIQIATAGAAFASTMTWARTASMFESALRRLCFVGGGLVRT